MPRAIAEAGLADAILDLSDLPAAIKNEVGAR
jgi:chemotaxis response regulator CheB